MNEHKCHARGCNVSIHPKFFACPKHWKMLTQSHRTAIWQNYRPGQERDKNPSERYLEVARRAIEYIAQVEGAQGELL